MQTDPSEEEGLKRWDDMDIRLWEDVANASRQCVHEVFSRYKTPAAVVRLAEMEQSVASQVIDQVNQLRKPKIACKKGCAWCCHAYISVTALEVFHIAEYVRATFSEEEIASLRTRLDEAEKRNAGLTWLEQENLRRFCPLLVDGACSVYPARPLACKGFTARSSAPCEHNFAHPDQPRQNVQFYVPFREVTFSVRVGLQQGLDKTPFQNDHLALIPALHLALKEPDLIERWLAGEKVFSEEALEK